MKKIIRNKLLDLSDILESTSKKIRGAAFQVSNVKPITLSDCEKIRWKGIKVVFVLSTGRTGTQLLNKLLSLSPDAYALHEPKPELIRSSKRAYEEIFMRPEIFEEVFKSAREELIVKALQFNKIFIETNNRITFFAPVIPKIFPDALFIHLVRHPGDFVRSGIRRKWYSGEHEHDVGRIVPVKGEVKEKWGKLTQIEKIGWLWNETNQFIENLKGQYIDKNRILFVKAESLFKDPLVTQKIYDFIGLTGFDEKQISKIIKRPINVQKKGEFPEYSDWTEKMKDELKRMVPLAKKYNYEL